MITADLHLHTRYSHGENSPEAMFEGAIERGLNVIGFSEHSPRPRGYDYAREYRDKLASGLPSYLRDVTELKARGRKEGVTVLLGMEMDWLHGEPDFARRACAAADFDYFLGSVHFLDKWGFDESPVPWEKADQAQCDRWYLRYFQLWQEMIASGLYQIAAHPDLIKIFSVERFHIWLQKPPSRALVRQCLELLQNSGMSMEISSAGLRKPCREIYPCAYFMATARELNVPITFASDAHRIDDIAYDFPSLGAYARSFGFQEYIYFEKGRAFHRLF